MTALQKLSYKGEDFPVYLARPKAAARAGLIVIHEVWGLNDHIRSIADRFVAEGYIALAPDLLSETEIAAHAAQLQADLFDPEKRNEAQPRMRAMMAPIQQPEFAAKTIERLRVCFDYLYAMPESRATVAVIGYCFGGSYAYSLSMKEERLAAALPYYGHVEASADVLRTISCPILAFYGEHDERLIGELPALKDAMKQAEVDFAAQVYPDCGHAFFNDTNPRAYNTSAAADAWTRTLAFLGAHAA